MRHLHLAHITLLVFLWTIAAALGDTKITDLPLGNPATIGSGSVFPGVDTTTNVTKKFKFSEVINIPALSANSWTVGKLLTGYSSTTGTLSASDSIVSGISKLNGNLAAISAAAISIGTYDSQSAAANGGTLSSNVLYFQSADATHPGMMSTGTQTVAGAKTFSGGVTATVTGHSSLDLAIASNLADLNSPSSARSNLGLGTAATATASTFSVGAGLSVSAGTGTGALLQALTLSIASGYTLPTNAQVSDWNSRQGPISIGAFSSSPTAAGLTITGSSINMDPADGTHPGGVSTGAQTIAGAKTFSSTIVGSVSGNAATVTTNANLTGPITSVGNATSIASQTGTGTKFVMDTSPTLVTPTIGAALATSLNGMGMSCSATTCTFQITSGKTFTVSNSLQLAGTDGSTLNVGTGGTLAASAYTDATNASNISSGTLPDARLSNTVSAGSCTNCTVTFDAHGRATTFSTGSGGGGTTLSVVTKTSTYQITNSDDVVLMNCTSSSCNANLQALSIANSVAKVYRIKNIGSWAVTVQGSTADGTTSIEVVDSSVLLPPGGLPSSGISVIPGSATWSIW